MWLYYVIVGVIFFATFAMSIQQGLWNNTLTTINILLSGLIAYGFYSPLAKLIADKGGDSYTALLDFVCIWALYVISFLVLQRLLAAKLSKTKMRFKHPIDPIGGPVMAAVAGWLMAGIVAASLHAAPFDDECFGGIFLKSGRSAATNPDVAWLNLSERMLAAENMGSSKASFTQGKYIKDFKKQREAVGEQESLRLK
ncbi:CvpA family protein [Aeoliella sp. ICT_H6.2]|uniref:CvpA family protein n=1 Tax=Aeoliella straminimaris TaxID=2954799 RepID=A0A9X2JHN8_9BACT|nr:CvpA family protein [Aeoliella straminimaris]MCO6046016.1 CvpA family protein [Aeoliella straminimaris]